MTGQKNKDVKQMELYSENVLRYYEHPPNKRKIAKPDFQASLDNPLCGDRIEVFIKTKNGKIAGAAFEGNGCAISLAAASMLLEKLEGKTVEEAKAVGEKQVLKMLGVPISPARMKCAFLGLGAVKKALKK